MLAVIRTARRTTRWVAVAGAFALAPAFASPVLAAPESAAAPPAVEKGVFFPETFTLSNGMQVVVVTNSRVPVVTHMMWYRVGAADDPLGQSGIAHFLEHLMFKGTDELTPGEFSRVVAKNGGRDNAFTSFDYTAYYQNVARDRLELVMKMEADRMADLQLTDEVVYPERSVVMEERRQRTENEPGDRLGEQFNATLFVRHPYGTPVIGWMPEIADLTRAEAEAFYRTWYTPNNAILVVAGDITAEELKPLAEKYYGVVPERAVPERARVVEPPIGAARRVILRDAEVRLPTWRRAWLAPSYRLDPDHHAYALQVLTEIMSGGATGRLYRTLVAEKKVATSAWMGYSPSSWDRTAFHMGGSPAPGTTMDALEAALLDTVRTLLDEGVTAEEVARAKKRMLAEAAYARDSLTGPAMALGTALTTGQSLDDVEEWPVRIAAVTEEQVEAAARDILGQTNHVTGLLLPDPDKGS